MTPLAMGFEEAETFHQRRFGVCGSGLKYLGFGVNEVYGLGVKV